RESVWSTGDAPVPARHIVGRHPLSEGRAAIEVLRALKGAVDLGETGEGAEDLGVVVGQVADDDVRVAEGYEGAELLHHLLDRAPYEGGGVEAAIAGLDYALTDRLRLRRRLAHVDVASDRDRRRPLAVLGAAVQIPADLLPALFEGEPGPGEPAVGDARGAVDGRSGARADPVLDGLDGTQGHLRVLHDEAPLRRHRFAGG